MLDAVRPVERTYGSVSERRLFGKRMREEGGEGEEGEVTEKKRMARRRMARRRMARKARRGTSRLTRRSSST
eukprot:957946-Prymnesium_polylepis.1